MVKIEADGISFQDALSKIHKCDDWNIRIKWRRDALSMDKKCLSGCIVEIANWSDEPPEIFDSAERAIQYIAKFITAHEQSVQERKEKIKNERSP